jgi:hypothetical protein
MIALRQLNVDPRPVDLQMPGAGFSIRLPCPDGRRAPFGRRDAHPSATTVFDFCKLGEPLPLTGREFGPPL